MNGFDTASVKRLYKAIALIQNEEECAAFFDDICTIKELQDMSQRLDTAILLTKGENYQTISKQVAVSTATISRVNRCLNYGSGGYKTILERLDGEKQ